MLFGKKSKPPAAGDAGPGRDGSGSGGVWQRLQQGLQKTRSVLTADLSDLFRGKHPIDETLLEEIETHLIMADVGVESTTAIIEALRRAVKTSPDMDNENLLAVLREQMVALLRPVESPLSVSAGHKPFVILVVGVNGVGKTTTIGKLASRFLREGNNVLLAAGDTFRAAAIDQLRSWGEKNNVPVIAQQQGADAAAVIYDALASARSRNADVVIADTAGRLHTKHNLMEELKKIRRTIAKFDPDIPVETLLVLDACTGQNAVAQTRQFNDAATVTGITLTKLDGSAKGGIIFALAHKLGIPVRFIGIGEQLDDLRPFNAAEFVDALLVQDP